MRKKQNTQSTHSKKRYTSDDNTRLDEYSRERVRVCKTWGDEVGVCEEHNDMGLVSTSVHISVRISGNSGTLGNQLTSLRG